MSDQDPKSTLTHGPAVNASKGPRTPLPSPSSSAYHALVAETRQRLNTLALQRCPQIFRTQLEEEIAETAAEAAAEAAKMVVEVSSDPTTGLAQNLIAMQVKRTIKIVTEQATIA